MAKKALITGSHGFLGSHLDHHLRKHNIEPIVFERAWFVSPDIANIIKSIKPDYIFHLAAAGNIQGKHDDVDIFSSNLGYLFNLLQAIKDIPLKGFINVSSSSVLLPYQTTYAATKLGAEAFCRAYVDQYYLPIVTMRPFSLYGPGDHSTHLIPLLFNAAIEGTSMNIAKAPMHDWTYVEDFVEVMIAYALKAKNHAGKIINVGSGKATSNWWVLDGIENITGKKIHIESEQKPRDYDTDEWVASAFLGDVEFTPTTLTQGLQKVYKSFILD